jgi:hypothetical protein
MDYARGKDLAIQIKSFPTTHAEHDADTESPDIVVENLMQVVDVVTRSMGPSK